jgi:predicted amidohydrolase YtcJ
VLGELETATKRYPRKDHRTVLVHFGFARPEQVKRWIELGGLISSNPYYVTALAGPYAKIGLGAERAKNIAPHKYVLDNKGSLSFHSDMPMAPAKPLQLAWAAVNRLTYEGQVVGPEHNVPLDIALKAITIDAAYSIQLEKDLGSIELGKRANLTILEQDPYAVKLSELKDIKIWGTMLEGRLQPLKNGVGNSRTNSRTELKPSFLGSSQHSANWNHRVAKSCDAGCSCGLGQAFAAAITSQLQPAFPER